MFAASNPSAAAHSSLRVQNGHVSIWLIICAIFIGATTPQGKAQAQSGNRDLSHAVPALSLSGGLSVDPVQAPLTFEPNLGQDPSAARYIAYGPGYLLRLEAARASIEFHPRSRNLLTPNLAGASSFSLTFAGSKAEATITAEQPQQAIHSYFPTSGHGKRLPDVPTYARVNYAGVYPGVDLSFYGNRRSLEYDLIVQPGADTQPIRIKLDGAEHVSMDAAGSLAMLASGNTFSLRKPVAYQLAADGVTHQPIEAHYCLDHHEAATAVSFAVGAYDHKRALIIDPVLLYGVDIPGAAGYSYPPYYFADTVISAMTVDGVGNTYVAATVASSYAAYSVMKFDPTGNLLYNVSLGSLDVYVGVQSIAIDATGDVYVAGSATPGLPTTPNAFEPFSSLPNGNQAGFLTVIKADASALIYSSYLGSVATGSISGVAVDSKGKAYVTGYTTSSSFPTTAGVFEPTTTNNYAANQGFVAKIDPTLSGPASLIYSTYLTIEGSNSNNSNSSSGYGIAVDGSDNAYVAMEAGAGFPVTAGAYHFDGISSTGAYLAKLNSTATALVYSAFLGPGYPSAIALDGNDEVYVAGSVISGEFPTTAGAYQTTYPGGFALKLSADGTSLLYSTFLGGPSVAQSYDVAPSSIAITPGCASACNAYIAGTTASINFPLLSPLQSFPGAYMQSLSAGQIGEQGFLVDLAANGSSVAFSTYLGANNSPTYRTDAAPAIGADKSGNLYFASNVQGPDAPVTRPAVQNPGEGFLLKISMANAASAIATPSQVTFGSQVVHSTSATPSIVELRNMGSQSITLTRPFAFTSKEFAETDSCGSTLAAGGICTLSVTFTPAASGTRSGTLTMASSAPNSPSIVTLTGTAVDGPNLVISTAALTFGDQVVDANSATQIVTLTNSGDEPQSITSIAATLPDYVITNPCGSQIAAGASCKISAVFRPTQIGLRSDFLSIQAGSFSYSVALSGTGVLSLAGTGTLTLSQSALNFDSIVLGSSPTTQSLSVLNTGDTPVTINGIAVTTSKGGASDFKFVPPAQVSGYPTGGSCGFSYSNYYENGSYYTLPFTLAAQTACSIEVSFAPSISGQETGTLTITDSATGSPQSAGLSAVGLSSVQALTVTPTGLTFPAQPIGDPSAAQTFTLTNSGQDYVIVDRVTTTGDFAIDDLGTNTCEEDTLGPLASCTVSVAFNPSATGSRSGTLVVLDTVSGTPQTFNLAGTGIQATGALQLGQTSLVFPAQAMGTSSTSEELILSNPGNSPVTINNLVTTGDFAVTSSYYNNGCSGVLAPDSTCEILVAFSPTKASGQATGTLTIHSTVGNSAVSLSGTAFTATQTIHLTPTQANFGNVLFATPIGGSSQITAYVENTGSAPVLFSAAPVITGTGSTPATDFSLSTNNCYPYIPFSSNYGPGSLPAGQNCSFTILYTPSKAAAEQATLSFVDSAGTQTMALTGTGVTTTPAVTLSPAVLDYAPQTVGSGSSPNYYPSAINLSNHGTTPLVINSVTVTSGSSDFSIYTPYGSCAGSTLSQNSGCTTYFVFTPSAVGYRTGTVSYVSSTGTTYTAALAGYAIAEVNSATLSPQSLVLQSAAVNAGTPSNYNEPSAITLTNTGNAPMIVGTVSGANVSSTGDFTIASPGGYDYCSGATVQPGSSCGVTVGFTPRATGTRTGSLIFPVTYANKATGSYTASLSGTGLTSTGSGNLLPHSATYPAQVAGLDTYSYEDETLFTLANSGTLPMTVGALTGTNLGSTPQTGSDFVIAYDNCSHQTVATGASCTVQLSFLPITVGQKTGSVTVPVTYTGGATGSFTSTLAGNSLAAAPAIEINQAVLNFNVEVVGTTDTNNVETAALLSTGNVPVTIQSITASPNFSVAANACGTAISQQTTCFVTVSFTPLASTPPGQVTGTLTVVDNAPGSPHVIHLAGTAISTAQQLALSQTSVSFPAEVAGTSSAPQVVYLVDLGSSSTAQGGPAPRVQINSIKLGGADPGDFIESENCGGTLGFTIAGRQGCMITVAFAPASIAQGTRTATVTITPAQGAPLIIQLVGSTETAAKRRF